MPQADAKLAKKWQAKDGSESKALEYLISKGWKEVKNGFIEPPQPKISFKEYEALQYLVAEWDFACETHLDVGKPQGFAAMSDEKRLEHAKKGGAAVPAHKRTFYDKATASRAGMRGGRMTPESSRTFKDPEVARRAALAGAAARREAKDKE